DRSGHVLVVSAPMWHVDPDSPLTATHGSAWDYDTHVPLLFAGPGVAAGRRIATSVGPQDAAPTLAALLGLAPMPQADGVSRLADLRR
ncbi:MAG TPA: hypothetical protein VGC54_10275, partial [Planctomycetota bacterium]